MAGLYIHIPFCKSKCAYCDFFSVATLQRKGEFLKAIETEMELQKNYLEKENLKTIYFGGGTPSILSIKEIEQILSQIKKYQTIEKDAEITLEANPDDLSVEYLLQLRKSGINRLSIGIQSFIDRDLKLMQRRHDSKKAFDVINEAQACGFDNISTDLIYGLNGLTLKEWKYNLDTLLSLPIKHLSAYHLTIEPNTLFNKWYKQNIIKLPTEIESVNQFEMLIKKTKKKNFIQYEISNFALDGFFSKHNSNYWRNEKYLGIGPSAHSYNLTSRQWNISSLPNYLDAISQGKVPYEKENLTLNDRYNDYIITTLRTMWGININKVENDFGKLYFDFLTKEIDVFVKNKLLKKVNDSFVLSEKGKFLSDRIISTLLYVKK